MKKIFIIIAVALASITSISCTAKTEPEPTPTPEPTMEIINRIDYWKEHPEEAPFEKLSKINALAKVADAVCPDDASEECLAAVMACVWNRSRTVGFPNTLEEVANQPYQWEGLTADFQPSREVDNLARKMLDEWESETFYYLPIPRNCVYLWLDDDGIWFRSEWNGEDECFIPYN
jgi:hypothetical protein